VELCLHSNYVFMAWCSVKAQGQFYLFTFIYVLVYRVSRKQNVATQMCEQETAWLRPVPSSFLRVSEANHDSHEDNQSLVQIRTHEVRYNINNIICQYTDWVVYLATGVQFPVGARGGIFFYRLQNSSGAHPASYLVGTRGSFPGVKVAGACN
jgi:hypothetical protein